MKFIEPVELEVIAKTIVDGYLVAFPTETVYGLGADADNEEAIKNIFKAKNRPLDHPLIVHISNLKKVSYWGKNIQPYVFELMKKFWPGPLTLIVQASSNVKPLVNANQESIAIRMPSNPIAKSIIDRFESVGGNGIVAPSANKFGRVSPTTAESVNEELTDQLNDSNLIVNGGICEFGIESTILDCRYEIPIILRPGPISETEIFQFLGQQQSQLIKREKVKFSGMHFKHYAPSKKVIINEIPNMGDGLIALKDYETPPGVIRLSSPVNSKEFAHNLYESLRLGDKLDVHRIVAIIPRGSGIESAILDRLRKASF